LTTRDLPGSDAARHGAGDADLTIGEMFAWIADGAEPEQAAAAIGTLPPPARMVYRALWKPRYARTPRW
jgi:hypothetical protein